MIKPGRHSANAQQSDTSAQQAASPVIAIAAGGTGGHRYIGQAIGEAYQSYIPESKILFLSSREDVPLPLSQIPHWHYATVASSPMTGQRFTGKLRSSGNLVRGLWHARQLLKRLNASLAIGCGSYASASVILAAKSLGLPTVIHEANVIPGRANRLLGRFVDSILAGWPQTDIELLDNTVEVGTPVRSDLLKLINQHKKRGILRKNPGSPPQLIVLGGSQGSRFLNRHIPELAGNLKAQGLDLRVVHQCGNRFREAVLNAYKNHGVEAVVEPFFNDLGSLYQSADFAISSAGATSLEELSAFSIPCYLIPLRNAADDHQTANARVFSRLTATEWMSERKWDQVYLSDYIASLLQDPQKWQAQSERVHQWWHQDAGIRIAKHCHALLQNNSLHSVHPSSPQLPK